MRARQDPARDERPQQPHRGARCAVRQGSGFARARTRWTTAPSSSPSQRLELTLRCRRCAPPPRPRTATPCTQPPSSPPKPIRTHARPCTVVCLRRSLAAPRALPRPSSGKPYLRVGKPTRHLAFGDSLWHDPIQRRTCFLTHLPSLAGSIGVSSHTRPPESSTGAPGRVGDTHPPVTPAPYAAWVTRLLRGFGRAARVLPPAALVRARPRPHLRRARPLISTHPVCVGTSKGTVLGPCARQRRCEAAEWRRARPPKPPGRLTTKEDKQARR